MNNKTNELIIEATTENIQTAIDFVELNTEDLPIKAQHQINIAVDEILANIANYAYHPEVGTVTIRISVGDTVILEFEDAGIPYNPLEQEEPDITASLEDRELGGLGIFMTKKLMDKVEYKRVGNKNILILKKNL
ncbi:MAG: ATP-binding protein [Ruminococcus sp.]|jgi:anti-sigma regulatory factor (Ser/Thr protein kinase)|nr:ATP-binding protein [Ruminococcus sp.]